MTVSSYRERSHFRPCPCGSMISGYLPAFLLFKFDVIMIAFCTEWSSDGRPSNCQSVICDSVVRNRTTEMLSVTGIFSLMHML
eukprot:gene19135-biopygen19401